MVEPQEAMFTIDQLRSQVNEPLIVVELDRPLPAFLLQRYHKLLRKAIGAKCNVFIGGTFERPKLPVTDRMASIGFKTKHGLSKVCFRLRDMYCTGVMMENDQFYEARSAGSAMKTVPDSIALGKGQSYADLLGCKGEKPELELKFLCLLNAHHEFLKLGTQRAANSKVLFGIGMIALIFMEPCRQAEIQELLLGAPGCYKSTVEYATISYGGTKWEVIRSWKKTSLVAEGLKLDNGVLILLEDRSKCLEAQKQVLILLSNDYIHVI